MKKEYKKPEILVEDFNICQNIASGCSITTGANHHQGACSIDTSIEDEFGDVVQEFLFNSNMVNICTTTIDQIDCHDGSNSYGGYFYS